MTVSTALKLCLSAALLHLVLIQPNHPAAMTWGALRLFPLELPVILLALLAAAPGRLTGLVRAVLVAALCLIAVLKAADYAMFTAFGRGFNPVADLPLAVAGLRLLDGSSGPLIATAAALGAVSVVIALAAALWWATGVWAALRLPRPAAWTTAGLAMAAAAVAVADIGHTMRAWSLPASPPGAAFTARVAVERVNMVRRTAAELRAFNTATRDDPFADRTGLLDIPDRDVLIVFIESYGRTSLDTPLYADLHRPTLERGAARLAERGVAMRSGLVAAPTRGGQSWLSHGTFANGLWIDNQTRYGAALASGRDTLFHIAARSGFHTAAVMPAITLDWPESAVMGFETVLESRDLGYRGLPFNWVTMPDQYTLSALDRMLRTPGRTEPLFAQIALISSHAPWVPVPELIDWDDVGDGEVFNDMAQSGDSPETVWRDRDRVRAQYRLSIDYSLQTVLDYALRHAGDPPLMIVLGDHQAAGFVAQEDSPDVPVHVIGPPHLVERVARWGWPEGPFPDTTAPSLTMDRMRDMILTTFSSTAPRGDGS